MNEKQQNYHLPRQQERLKYFNCQNFALDFAFNVLHIDFSTIGGYVRHKQSGA